MSEILHAWALAPAAAGACCLIADRRPLRLADLGAALLMLLAMVDVATFRVVAPVGWGGILLVAALVFAAAGSRMSYSRWPSSRPRVATAHSAMTAKLALGLIVMALLMVVMDGSDGDHAPSGQHHSQIGLPIAWVAAGAAVSYGAASVLRAGLGFSACRGRFKEGSSHFQHAHVALMGISTALMGVAVLAH